MQQGPGKPGTVQNLTIRQSSAYLSRRTLSHARSTERLDEHLELLRCYYNFVRPHGALKFGREIRTPAMQAGLTTRRLTFRTSSWRRRFLCDCGSRFSCSLGRATRSLPHLYHCPQPRSNHCPQPRSNISGLLNQHLSQKSLPQSCSSKSVTSGSDCKHIYGLSEERLGCSGP